ncbi:hypothetical protein F5B21DRAFT_478708 [Xylaria acuta]|nr:hypothetical protein F5B21DRAFT_478708 [Xylaria acuta]
MLSVLRLPYELRLQIASDETLSRHDLAAMRLVCRRFAAPVASVLFRRVKMSRLRVDRDSFEHIAASDHLARHVRELVWHELDLEAWIEPGERAPFRDPTNLPDFLLITRDSLVSNEDFILVRQLMAGAAYNTSLFWFPRMPSGDYQDFLPSSVDWFVATLGKFPHLTTFISCPMPQGRVITYKEYPIDPDLYRQQSWIHSLTSNSGFFSYMLEAMKRAESNVRTLSWQDENIHLECLGNELLHEHILAFRALTTIEFCPTGFNRIQYDDRYDIDMMVLCLKAATNLRHLSLCYERLASRHPCHLLSALLRSCAWPALTSLEVSNITFSEYPMVRFLNRCTGIRRLVFRECTVFLADIAMLRQISPCQLTSIIITGGDHYFPESFLLEYVSRRSPILLDSDGNPAQLSLHEHTICTESPDDDDDWTPTFSDNEESDPLEYFSDWDSEVSDEVTPLSDGEAFKELCESSSTTPGTEPPPGAIPY